MRFWQPLKKTNESMNIPEIWISTSVVEASLDIDF